MTNQQLAETCRDILAEADKQELIARIQELQEQQGSHWTGNYPGNQLDQKIWHIALTILTAPPVPEMKPIELPKMISSWEGDDVISGRNKGIADCAEALRKQGYEVAS